MPAIASLEDLKAAEKEDFGIYAMLYASSRIRARITVRDTNGMGFSFYDL